MKLLPMIKNILIIEDEEAIRQYLKELLLENNFSVRLAPNGTRGLASAKKVEPDLVILDLGLPDLAGETVCKELRKYYPELPIIILTALDSPQNIVKGLDLGANDYVTKPFDGEVLLARIKARLRESGGMKSTLKVDDLVLNNKTLEVKRGGRAIDLTPQEFKLLEYLMGNKNQVLSRDMILNRIWLYSPDIETRVVDVYIGYLRKKIDNGFAKKLIHSVRGFGYVIKD